MVKFMRLLLLLLVLLPNFAFASTNITICIPENNPPFAFVGDDHKLQGFDIDMLEKMQLPYTLQLHIDDFPSSLAGLQDEKCQMVLSDITINEDRKNSFLFTNPHINTGLYAAVLSDSPITSTESIEYSNMGVVKGSMAETFAFSQFRGGVIYALRNYTELMSMLEHGTIETIIDNLPQLQHIIKNNSEKIRILEPYIYEEQLAYAVTKSRPDLHDIINISLERMQNDGSIDKIYEKWFGVTPKKTVNDK